MQKQNYHSEFLVELQWEVQARLANNCLQIWNRVAGVENSRWQRVEFAGGDKMYTICRKKLNKCTALKLLRFERSLPFFFIRQRTAISQSLGETELRNKAVKKEAIRGAIIKRIGATIDFEMPSRPNAQFFKSSKPDMTSMALRTNYGTMSNQPNVSNRNKCKRYLI